MSVAFMCLGLLLWARFILVTGHPRTATASPVEPLPELTRTVVVVPENKTPVPPARDGTSPAPAATRAESQRPSKDR